MRDKQMKSVCITGVAGFIGSHLAKRYMDLGWKVFGIDDFSSSLKTSNHFRALKRYDNFEFQEISIENTDAIFAQCRNRKFDLILNFACPASPPGYQAIPLKTLDTCFTGTKNMLMIAKMHDARFIHASTSEIYGDPLTSPQKETDWGNVNCFGVRSMYDEGKRVSETLCREYMVLGVDVRVIRIFNTYGTQMDKDDGRVVTNFFKQAMLGDDITIYGDGSQTRSFCYVSDLVDGIHRLSNLSINPRFPINLGNPSEFTVNELAEKIIKLFGNKSKIIYKSLPGDDPRQRQPDISKAIEILKWTPHIPLNVGLLKMLNECDWIVKSKLV